jgi:hypothetical protein
MLHVLTVGCHGDHISAVAHDIERPYKHSYVLKEIWPPRIGSAVPVLETRSSGVSLEYDAVTLCKPSCTGIYVVTYRTPEIRTDFAALDSFLTI